MSMTAKQLESAARRAYRNGESWQSFWDQYGDAVRAAEPFDRRRFNRLLRRLHHLVLCGNGSDQPSPPWDVSYDDTEETKTVQQEFV